jgi:hypothetical protein
VSTVLAKLQPLSITPSLGATLVEASVEARCWRDDIIALGAPIKAIEDRLDADDATATLKSAQAFLDLVETERVAKGGIKLANDKLAATIVGALMKDLPESQVDGILRVVKILNDHR